MSYTSNPLIPKARADAVRLMVEDRLPIIVAARRSGIHRTTLWRWCKQWQQLNEHLQRKVLAYLAYYNDERLHCRITVPNAAGDVAKVLSQLRGGGE